MPLCQRKARQPAGPYRAGSLDWVVNRLGCAGLAHKFYPALSSPSRLDLPCWAVEAMAGLRGGPPFRGSRRNRLGTGAANLPCRARRSMDHQISHDETFWGRRDRTGTLGRWPGGGRLPALTGTGLGRAWWGTQIELSPKSNCESRQAKTSMISGGYVKCILSPV